MQSTVCEISEFMLANSLYMVTAESCTAGLIAATLADVPGAGGLLDCAYIVYSVEAKQRCLGVKQETLERCNLTSETIAREMAAGALANSAANVALANTGVTDDTDKRVPAGTQCFAWAFKCGSGRVRMYSETRRFEGDRNQIRQAAADYALLRIPVWFAHG